MSQGSPAVEAAGRIDYTYAEPATLIATIWGDWLLRDRVPSVERFLSALEGREARTVRLVADGLGEWDSALLAFVTQVGELCRDRGIELDRTGLPEGLQKLWALAEAVPEKEDAEKEEERPSLLEWVGVGTLSAGVSARDHMSFLGQLVLAFGRMLRGQAKFRGRDQLMLIQQAGVEALPIVSLVSFLLGLILAFVGAIQLQQFGAAIFVANLVGIGMVRDMGALITAIVMAGRSGASYAAQIGSMKVNEETDALVTMGISPIDFLVLPRFIALVLMMPLLTMYADIVGILGGLFVGVSMLNISFTEYFSQTNAAISMTDAVGGVLKGAVYGGLVAIAGCMRGIQAGRSSAAVGDATTAAVVTGIVWIIAACGIFAWVFYALGI